MPVPNSTYLSNRVLKINVGYLLNVGPGNSKDTTLDLPHVKVDDDLILNSLHGHLRLSRTKEGVLVQAQLLAGITDECFRCLAPVDTEILLEIEELFATSDDISVEEAEFHISDDGQLDLASLVRAEVLIKTTRGIRCDDVEDCDERMRALKGEAGMDDIDPRMAKLKVLLDAKNNT